MNRFSMAGGFMVALSFLFLIACDKEELIIDGDNLLLGTWVSPTYDNNKVTYSRSSSLEDDDYGIIFHADGSLVMRENAGWCGTPPISYANYEGTWNIQGDLIKATIRYQWMPEDSEYSWQLVSVNKDKLVLEYLEPDYD